VRCLAERRACRWCCAWLWVRGGPTFNEVKRPSSHGRVKSINPTPRLIGLCKKLFLSPTVRTYFLVYDVVWLTSICKRQRESEHLPRATLTRCSSVDVHPIHYCDSLHPFATSRAHLSRQSGKKSDGLESGHMEKSRNFAWGRAESKRAVHPETGV
jgi:hypothetical protein